MSQHCRGRLKTILFWTFQSEPFLFFQIHKITDVCWDICVDNVGSSLGRRTESCLSNCSDRFIDTTLFVTNRFAQLASKMSGGRWKWLVIVLVLKLLCLFVKMNLNETVLVKKNVKTCCFTLAKWNCGNEGYIDCMPISLGPLGTVTTIVRPAKYRALVI